MDRQVHVVGFAVDLTQPGTQVRAHLAHDLFASGEHRVVDHATAVRGGGNHVNVQVPYDATA